MACVVISLPAPLACSLLSNGMVKVIITINSLTITNITIVSFLAWWLMSEEMENSFLKVLGLNVCLVSQSCPTLCDPVDCSPPGSSVRGIFQARILEWVAISSSRVSSQPREQT